MSVKSRQLDVQMRKMQVRSAHQESYDTEQEPDDKTDEIKICPGHSRSPFLTCESPAARGCKASSRRSASPGVSKIAPSSTKHLRVSFSRASLMKILLSSPSPAKRSEACNNHTSRLPSVVRKSEVSSV